MHVIGMISGTSYDAIEAVALDMSLDGDAVVAELLGHDSVPYPREVRDQIAAVLPPATTTVDEVCRLDTLVGQSFADVAAALGERCCAGVPDVVASHGQTVFHWVESGHARGTLQLGQAAWIAERTGATVVSDLRSRDVAAGGHGAPLASLLDVMLLGTHPERVSGAVNLGGIANVTVVGAGREPLAFDIGPANALIDAAVTWTTGGEEDHDHDGARALRGEVDPKLLARLLDEPYYRASPPKSTGKELFHLGYLRDHLDRLAIAADDLVATLTMLTATTVAEAVAALGVERLVASGGGTRNPALMAELARRLPGVELAGVEAYGIPEAAKEAVVFALAGFLTVHGLPSTIPSCTGAVRPSVLGAVVLGRQVLVRLPETSAPVRFEMRRVGAGT